MADKYEIKEAVHNIDAHYMPPMFENKTEKNKISRFMEAKQKCVNELKKTISDVEMIDFETFMTVTRREW